MYELGIEPQFLAENQMMLAYLHGEQICLMPLIFFLIGIPIAFLVSKLIPKDNDK
jgi:hypothetical protein